ncbi:MAG: PAS domain S-box protein [Candidatus Coatesbacteria bacterium]|nr:PAS domain S-box protein [Candidatus Coatesbacteria bacterium]
MTDDSREKAPTGKEGIDLLTKAFDSFSDASDSMKRAYESLQRQVKELDLELKLKNAQLKENIAELESVKNYIDNVLQSVQNGVVSIDLEGRITTFNRAASEIIGIGPRDAIGQHYWQILGSEIDPVASDGKIHEIQSQSGADLVLSFNTSPLAESDGRPVGHVISFLDVTRLKELESELRKQARLAAMGEMAANLAHEIRNPLGSIKLFASVLERKLESELDSKNLATHIMETVDALDASITNMLIYARSPEADFSSLPIEPVIQEAIESATYAIVQNGIRLTTDFSAGNIEVSGDRRFLKQAFSNIILNGAQALHEDGGHLSIVTRIASPSQFAEFGKPIVTPKAPCERYLAVVIADSGKGLPDEDHLRIFEPFFSTKTMGTGLGLSIVKRVVQRHDGCLFIRESQDGGLEFTVALPIS